MTDHDFGPAVESLIAIHNGEPGRPVGPRTLPPRPLPAPKDTQEENDRG